MKRKKLREIVTPWGYHGDIAAEVGCHINSVKDALVYYTIVKEILGEEWLTTDLFRIGASSAANNLLTAIEDKEVRYY